MFKDVKGEYLTSEGLSNDVLGRKEVIVSGIWCRKKG